MTPALSGTTSRLAAIALLIGMAVALYVFAVAPLAQEYSQAERRIAQANELLARYQRIAGSREALKKRLDELALRQTDSGVYLSGGTDALAGAKLQEIVNKTVESGGGGLRSIQVLPVKTDGDFRRVGVRVQLTATITQVAQILYTLEGGTAFLFVDSLDISNRRTRRRRGDPVDMDPVLLVRLDLSGYLRPEVE